MDPPATNLHFALERLDHLRRLGVVGEELVEQMPIDLLRIAIRLLVEGTLRIASRPRAPRVVIDHVAENEMAEAVITELELRIDEEDIPFIERLPQKGENSLRHFDTFLDELLQHRPPDVEILVCGFLTQEAI